MLFPAKTMASDWLTELVDQSKAWFFGGKEHLKYLPSMLYSKNDDFSSRTLFYRIWIDLTGFDLIWQDLTRWQDLIGLNCIQDRNWQELTGFVKIWLELTASDWIRQELTGLDRMWQDWAGLDRIQQDLAWFDRSGKKTWKALQLIQYHWNRNTTTTKKSTV